MLGATVFHSRKSRPFLQGPIPHLDIQPILTTIESKYPPEEPQSDNRRLHHEPPTLTLKTAKTVRNPTFHVICCSPPLFETKKHGKTTKLQHQLHWYVGLDIVIWNCQMTLYYNLYKSIFSIENRSPQLSTALQFPTCRDLVLGGSVATSARTSKATAWKSNGPWSAQSTSETRSRSWGDPIHGRRSG